MMLPVLQARYRPKDSVAVSGSGVAHHERAACGLQDASEAADESATRHEDQVREFLADGAGGIRKMSRQAARRCCQGVPT